MTENRNFNKINIVISVVIAFIAWVYVVYNYSPMKTVTFTNVPITYVGMDVLADRGLGIKSTTLDAVDVDLDVKRVDYTDVTADDITVTADVSQASNGHNGISLVVESPDSAVLKKMSSKMVSVEVADSSIKDVDVALVYDNNPGDGTEPIAHSMSYRRVSVVGYSENVDKVKYAVIKLKADNLSADSRSFVLEPVAVDENGRKVAHVQVLPSEISASVAVGRTKEVELIVSVHGVERGIYYNVPKTVKIKGIAEAINKVDKIEAEPIDLTGVTANTTIPVQYNLPEGVYLAQDSMTQSVVISKEKN